MIVKNTTSVVLDVIFTKNMVGVILNKNVVGRWNDLPDFTVFGYNASWVYRV